MISDIQSRIIRAPMHRDGSPGLLYFRVRIEQADPRLRPVRVDLPLCTTSRTEAAARAYTIIKALHTLGRRVMGDFPLSTLPAAKARPKPTQKPKAPPPPLLPGAGKWI